MHMYSHTPTDEKGGTSLNMGREAPHERRQGGVETRTVTHSPDAREEVRLAMRRSGTHARTEGGIWWRYDSHARTQAARRVGASRHTAERHTCAHAKRDEQW